MCSRIAIWHLFLALPRARSSLVWAALCTLAACASSHFDGTHFRKPQVQYRVGPLSGAWQRVAVEDSDLTFYREGAGTIRVQATCGGYDDVPNVALLNHLLFGTTRRRYLVDEDVTLDGRGARHAVIDCELDGAPVRLDLYVLSHGGCVFDLGYISSAEAVAEPQFANFVRGFHVERTP